MALLLLSKELDDHANTCPYTHTYTQMYAPAHARERARAITHTHTHTHTTETTRQDQIPGIMDMTLPNGPIFITF